MSYDTTYYDEDLLDYEDDDHNHDEAYDAEDGLGNDGSEVVEEDYHAEYGAPPSNPVGDVPVVDFRSLLTLCPDHGNHVSLDCVHCKKLQEIVSPTLLKQMGITVSGSDSSIPEVSSWLSQSKPKKKHYLTLDAWPNDGPGLVSKAEVDNLQYLLSKRRPC